MAERDNLEEGIAQALRLSGNEILERYFLQMDSYGSDSCLSIDGGIEIAFDQFRRYALQVSSFLCQGSVASDDKVALLSESRPEYIPTVFGIIQLGAVVVPLDTRAAEEELAQILEHSEATTLLVSDQYMDKAANACSKLGRNIDIFSIEQTSCERGQSIFSELGSLEEFTVEEFASTKCSLLAYTSGSTGKPKGVMLSVANICAQVLSIPQDKHLQGATLLSVLPLSHMFNLTSEISKLYNNARIHYIFSFLPNELSDCMQIQKPNYMICVPTVLTTFKQTIERQVARSGRASKVKFKLAMAVATRIPHKLRRRLFKKVHAFFGDELAIFYCGGAALPAATWHFFEALGFKVVEGYGLTETAPVCTANTYASRVPGSVGKALPTVELKLVADPSSATEGVIHVRGPNVMLGYYKDLDATNEVLSEDKWFNTGDIGSMDSDGNIFISGRSKSLIVLRGGKKVQPEQIEALLQQSNFVEEVCVVSLPQGTADRSEAYEIVAAVIKPSVEASKNFDQEEIEVAVMADLATLKKQVADYKWPTKFIFTDESLPRTSTQKFRRSEIAKIFTTSKKV